jgi:hypothetical protein
MHDYAIDAVRRALPTARVWWRRLGRKWRTVHTRDFIEHCLTGTILRERGKGNTARLRLFPRERRAALC